MAHAEPAIVLADEDAGKAHLAELSPQIVTEPVLAVFVAKFAQMRDGRLVRHEGPCTVLHHGLIVVEIKWHW